MDYKIFPEKVIQKSEQPYVYEKNGKFCLETIWVNALDNKKRRLNEFIESTNTTSFLIVKNDQIIFEKYANGFNETSINTSFSMAKSIVSLLIGKAIELGYINSVQDPILNYIPEFECKEIGKVTIEELLLMRSKITYNEDKFLWFGDDSLTYWYDDLRSLALSHTTLTEEYNGKFHYNNYHPLLLGIVLERSTGQSVSQFFEKELWQCIGAEYDASWSLDSEKYVFEKMESGINFKAKDFVKIGSMLLHHGYWNGRQIISKDWIEKSTLCKFPLKSSDYASSFLFEKNIGYQYMWYCIPTDNGGYDIAAWGKSDQILYISYQNDIVILRTGKSDGGVSNWIEVLMKLTSSIKEVCV